MAKVHTGPAGFEAALAEVTSPSDPSKDFDKLLRELLNKVDEEAVTAYAISLLDGDDPGRFPNALRHLGGSQAGMVLKRGEFEVWPAVWGARALRYVWHPRLRDESTRVIVEHLSDSRWRVAETCAKVVRVQKLAAGADGVVALTHHRLARVRMQAVRALGMIATAQHVPVLEAALDDPDIDVRHKAEAALERTRERLG